MAYTTINKSTDNFSAVTYTGNGSLPRAITGIGHSPDFVWAKDRDTAYHHQLHDTVRGIAAGAIYSSANNANDTTYHMDSFDTDGFTMGTDLDAINGNTKKIVAWNWLAGGKAPTQTYTVKVVSDSGNKYRFDDFGTSAVTLDLQEGGTYTFDVSDSSMDSHPFVIGTAANGTEYSTGVTYKLDGVTKTYSQYTSGFSAATSRQLIITLAASAPALYYWCSVHSGMGGAINTNTTHGSSNFSGSIQSTVSVNTAAGFSIVSYTGTGSATSVGHGLGVKPDFVISKAVSSAGDWNVYQKSFAAQQRIKLNSSNGKSSNSSIFPSVPTNQVVNIGTGGDINTSSATHIFYCFASKTGYCKIGNYIGNGNASGTFTYTGFKPSFIMLKNVTNDGDNWTIYDEKRDINNPANRLLFAQDTAVEAGGNNMDIFSNGFKQKNTSNGNNGSTDDFIYMAFGQTIVGSNNVPATAF